MFQVSNLVPFDLAYFFFFFSFFSSLFPTVVLFLFDGSDFDATCLIDFIHKFPGYCLILFY